MEIPSRGVNGFTRHRTCEKNVGVGDKAGLHFVVDKLNLTYAILILHVDPPHIYESVHILQNHSHN